MPLPTCLAMILTLKSKVNSDRPCSITSRDTISGLVTHAMQLNTANMHRRLLDKELIMTPEAADGNKTSDSFISDPNFDTNMVIILAALLCALICALGLNSIVRCALSCRRRISSETRHQVAARLSAKGLKKRDLSQIPVIVYGSGANIPATECPICLGEFEKGDKVRMLPKCNHAFHVRCIDRWLMSNSSCPTCRHSLLDKSANSNTNQEVAGARPPENGSGRQGGFIVVVAGQS
ncbi:hypothetical protein L6164_000192 [Bauhinia variegata]|uniref:Uncharacterized protein n=1 Tax=Bauhinia variegata TaxID=167791 RepID=A0ACB9Q8G2_BAUVA|nr:hypothetical protein L6164_000192 [Bauhinia variegata]